MKPYGKSLMEIIRDGLKEKCEPRAIPSPFSDAVYELFREFTEKYNPEWARIDDNEQIYQGDHWAGVADPLGDNDARKPRPTTPIITSTIENIKADLSDEFPEAVVIPENPDNEIAAKILTQVVKQELSACEFSREYDKITQDVLNCGWCPIEIGFDQDMNLGLGGTYVRYVINKNFMCDPQVIDMQEGRAVFKFDRRPIDWFMQHYPDYVEFMRSDDDLVHDDHDDFNSTTTDHDKKCFRLIEAWFRIYDPKTHKHAVHMVLLAGRQVLESSYLTKPNGYYKHGKYPFVITTLYPQKGSPLGLGITDMFKDAQRYSDKLDQILLINTFQASRPRMLIQRDMVDYDDARDFSKEVIETDGNPAAAMVWQQANPLPSHIMAYISSIRESIKAESGSNESSRGNTSSGVTAASAISALQDMSTKRSRMEARALHYGFKEAINMLLETLREHAVVERKITITLMGAKMNFPFSVKTFREVIDDDEIPLVFHVDVKTTRQTKYTKQMHNDLWLQMMQTMQGQVDPAIMLEGIEFDEKERLLDNIQRAQAGGMLNLQKQLQEMSEQLQATQEELEQYKATAQQMGQALQSSNERLLGIQESTKAGIPSQQGEQQQPQQAQNWGGLSQLMG